MKAVGFIILILSNFAFGEYRFWTDVEGRTIEAEFVAFDEPDLVRIRKAGNQATYSVPISRLSDSDQQFLIDLRSKKNLSIFEFRVTELNAKRLEAFIPPAFFNLRAESSKDEIIDIRESISGERKQFMMSERIPDDYFFEYSRIGWERGKFRSLNLQATGSMVSSERMLELTP